MFTPWGEHSLLFRRMEGRTENFTPMGQNSHLGDNFAPCGESLPLGPNLRMGLRCLSLKTRQSERNGIYLVLLVDYGFALVSDTKDRFYEDPFRPKTLRTDFFLKDWSNIHPETIQRSQFTRVLQTIISDFSVFKSRIRSSLEA
jgi:hypothetical protein